MNNEAVVHEDGNQEVSLTTNEVPEVLIHVEVPYPTVVIEDRQQESPLPKSSPHTEEARAEVQQLSEEPTPVVEASRLESPVMVEEEVPQELILQAALEMARQFSIQDLPEEPTQALPEIQLEALQTTDLQEHTMVMQSSAEPPKDTEKQEEPQESFPSTVRIEVPPESASLQQIVEMQAAPVMDQPVFPHSDVVPLQKDGMNQSVPPERQQVRNSGINQRIWLENP